MATPCLRNLFDIRDQEQLHIIEASFVTIRTWELERTSFDKTFDLQHLKAIHKHLFQDIYEWAGQIRHVDILKGETCFSLHSRIESDAQYTFAVLKDQKYLKGLDADAFSKKAGYYMGEINYIHPFREGNGRTQREFINQLAHYNGYHIEWKNISKKQMIEASIESFKGKEEGLVNLIRENLIDRDRLLAIDQTYRGAHDKICLAETGKNYKGPIIGSTERYAVQALKDFPDHVILHNRHSLSRSVTPDTNKEIEISYPHGAIGLVRESEVLKEKDSSKAHDLQKDPYQYE